MPRGLCGRILYVAAKQPLSPTVVLLDECSGTGCMLIKGADANLRVHVSSLGAGAGS